MPVILSIIGPLTGGGHAAPAVEAELAAVPPIENKAAPAISMIGAQTQPPPSLTYKGSFVFGK